MTLLELNEIIKGNYEGAETNQKPVPLVEASDVEEFMALFAIDDRIKGIFDMTENYIQFYKALPWVKKCIKQGIYKEVFYAAKTGVIYEDVPPTIVFIFKRAMQSFGDGLVNLSISKIDRKMLIPYMKKDILPDTVTYKDVIESITGDKVKLITSSQPAVTVGGIIELYVPNVDAVAIVPADMLSEVTSLEDYDSVTYDKAKGLLIKGTPIRTLGGRIGLTRNDLDLRGCL